MRRKNIFLMVPGALCALALAACNLGVKPPSSQPILEIPTLLPTQPVASTPAPIVTATLPSLPTRPPLPTAAPFVSQSGRVSMAAGGTQASITGSVSAGGSTDYLVGAQAGQYMLVSISSIDPSLALQVLSPAGSTLLSATSKLTTWQGTLSASGDYRVSAVSPASDGGAATFDLSITIPVRVTFQPGAVSATLSGQISGGLNNTYLLRALKDQTLGVTVSSPSNDIYLTIYGLQDGQPYVRSSLGVTHASFKLPSTQDYVIVLVPNSNSEAYSVQFTAQ